MVQRGWKRWCALAGLIAAATCLGADRSQTVTSTALGLVFRAPNGWIVRHLTSNDEHVVAITRELRDGFPRFDVGFSATSVDGERRRKGVRPTVMARELCAMAQKRGIVQGECHISQPDGLTRVEWKVFYPPDSIGAAGTLAWIVCLADEPRDQLVRLIFEAPEREWSAVESTATELMSSVRRSAIAPPEA